jgi:alpha-L-rhamnosidase
MKPYLLTLAAILFCSSLVAQNLAVQALKCEYKVNPLGLDVMQPRLSWQLSSSQRSVQQAAYRIRVAKTERDLRRTSRLLWDTDKLASDQSVHVVYEGEELTAGQRYYWQVKVWAGEEESEWSDPAYWEMGLLKPSDWQAQWITPSWEEDKTTSQSSPLLRKEFRLNGKVKSARAYLTSLGLYEAEINGQKVGDQLFTPGWTSFNQRLQYQTYDITNLLQTGSNAIGVTLGDGWYRGYLVWQGRRNTYGEKLGLLCQLEIEYTNGKRETIISDNSWKAAKGPILKSDIYMGETYDARLERSGWTKAGFDDLPWRSVALLPSVSSQLIAPAGPPVRAIDELKPVRLFTTPEGDRVFDMGQNMVGWVKLKVQGPAGTRVVLRHAEVLDKEGNFYTANLRRATQRVEYILKGEGMEVYEPHFTFQGFRYVAIEGYPGELNLDAIRGVVIHSDMPVTGSFSCSHPLLNQLQHNIQWGQKGNFLDVPTDCPQRDERMGWTGDAQVFARTAAFNMQVGGFFTKWLGDVKADQLSDGRIPFVIPQVMRPHHSAATGWADVATIIPWNNYLVYGDTRILETQFESMQAWVDFMLREAGDDRVWDTGFHFGDWLFYSPDDDRDGKAAVTYKPLIQQAFLCHSLWILTSSAEILGKTQEAEKYRREYEMARSAFQREYVTPAGRLVSGTQTAYVLALQFDLLREDLRPIVAQRLVENIESYGNHLTTGFLGTPYLCHVLSRFGHLDKAYDLLLQETYPSWLYPVKMGATTIWERWDGIKPDSSFQNVGMNSFNHYAYGAIGDWMYQNLGGIQIDPAQPGYKHIVIRPQPGGGITQASTRYESLYGTIATEWELDENQLRLQVEIPANTTAMVYLPAKEASQASEGDLALPETKGIDQISEANGELQLSLGSGTYDFVVRR